MRIEELTDYGLHPIIISKLNEMGYNTLTETQIKSVQEGLFDGSSLLVNAPTNTGKTFIGELAVLYNSKQQNKRRSFFLVPMKALAEQIFRDFIEKYSTWGLSCTISTADQYEEDDNLANFDVVIATYEKLDSLLVKNPKLLQDIGLVVIDEIQYISDQNRGINLEFLITKLIIYSDNPQLIGLSATATNADQLASWLKANLVQVNKRDVELKEGVLYTGIPEINYNDYILNKGDFLYKEFNSQAIGIERELHLNQIPKISELCKSEQCIMFLSTVRRTQEIANDLIKFFPENPELIDLQTELDSSVEHSPISRKLREVMKHSVAFHHAGLLYEERRIVEKAFRNGKRRIITATTTLGAGINTPAKNVIILFNKYWDGSPLLVRTYKNISGRAGRLRIDDDFGRSLLFARNLKEFDIMWRNYVNARPEFIQSQIPKKRGLPCSLLGLISSGVSSTRDELRFFIMCSFLGHTIKDEPEPSQDHLLKDIIENEISFLIENDFLIENNDKLEITELGIRCAEEQLSPSTILLLYRSFGENIEQINQVNDYNQFLRSIIHLCCSTRDAYLLYAPRSQTEIEELDALWEVNEESFFYTPKNRELYLKSLRTTRMIQRWLEGASYYNLSSYAQAGQIKRIAENIHWILRGCARLIQKPLLSFDEKFNQFLYELSERVFYGVSSEALPILRVKIDGIQRRRAMKLAEAGFSEIDDFLSASIDELIAVDEINDTLANRIKANVEVYIKKGIDRFRALQSREIMDIGHDPELITKLYDLHGDDYTRHIVYLLKEIMKIDAEFIGEIGPHEPDIIINSSKGRLLFEGKRKEGGKVNTKEAEEILGKGAKYNPVIFGTFGHPDFVKVAQKNALNTELTLIPTHIFGSILIKYLKSELTNSNILDILSAKNYVSDTNILSLELI